MSQNLYELIALGARYLFAALMVLIVARAWRITIVDSRRAKTLRRLSPETGIVGELIVVEGDEKARRGMRYPVTLEGMLGASRRADIRIRHSSVRRRHAWFQMTLEGLSLRAHAGAPMRLKGRPAARELLLRDGDVFEVGRVWLMLVLSVTPEETQEEPVRRSRARGAGRADDDLFDADDVWDDGDAPDAGQLFAEHPLLTRVTDAPGADPCAPDEGEDDDFDPDGDDGPVPDDLFFDD